MKKIFAVAAVLLLAPSGLEAQDTLTRVAGDSVIVSETGKMVFSDGDTLADLNRLNSGVLKFQVSEETQKVIDANGLSISGAAVITVKNASMTGQRFTIEVKTFASDEEWYINIIKFNAEGNVPMLYVNSDKIEMATGWRKDGKIYVVLAVAAILFGVIIAYLFYLDRKTAALKKKIG